LRLRISTIYDIIAFNTGFFSQQHGMMEYWGFEAEQVIFIKTDRIPFFPKNRPAKLPAGKRTSKPIIFPLSIGMSEMNQVHFRISFNEKEPFGGLSSRCLICSLIRCTLSSLSF